jgi:cobalt-zinc-cadmium efflux system outer membrane protein
MIPANRRNWARGWLSIAALVCCCAAGCFGGGPARTVSSTMASTRKETVARVEPSAPLSSPTSPIAQIVFSKPASLNLDDLIALASQNNPDLVIAQAQVEAARGRLVQAGLYPNPVIGPRIDELGNNRNQWGSPGATINQEIVAVGKLKRAKAAAAHGVAVADWQAMSRWFDVVTRVRIAYYDVLTAEREVRTNREIVELTQKSLDVARKLLKLKGTQIDVLRAEVEQDQSRTRLAVAEKRLEATWRILGRVVGVRDLPAGELEGDLELKVSVLEWPALLERMLEQSSEMQVAYSAQLQADQLLRRAQIEPIPNALVTVQPGYSVPDRDMKVEVVAGFAIPLFNRNQGNIAAAQAEVARTRAVIRQVELQLTEQLTNAFQRYQSAQQQVTAYRDRILPNARESLRLVQLAYEKGAANFDLTAVLQAQQTLVQARLQYVQALGELWRAVSEIRGLVQE